MDSPSYAHDLKRAAAECKAFAETYRGKLAMLAEADLADPISARIAEAVSRYEALEDLLEGRHLSQPDAAALLKDFFVSRR